MKRNFSYSKFDDLTMLLFTCTPNRLLISAEDHINYLRWAFLLFFSIHTNCQSEYLLEIKKRHSLFLLTLLILCSHHKSCIGVMKRLVYLMFNFISKPILNKIYHTTFEGTLCYFRIIHVINIFTTQ